MEQILAIVLAGGNGKRMDILCRDRPKPLLPFAGRFRVIDFSLSNCIRSGIQNIAVLADYQRTSLEKYLGRWRLNNSGVGEFHILVPLSGSYKGTADAIYQNLDFLGKHNSKKVLVLAGDHVYKMDYRDMLAFHTQMEADATMGIIQVPIEEAHQFGVVTTDSEDRVVEFFEKPKHPQSNLVSMGIYVFNKTVLHERLIEDAALADSTHDFGYNVLPNMIRRDRVFAYRFNNYWRDIGTASAFYEANMDLIGGKIRFSLDGRWSVLTAEDDSPLPRNQDAGSVVNSIISPGCIVGGQVENSVLSSGVRIEEQAVVKNSVLMANVSIGYHSVIDQCILDEEVNIGKFCYVGFGSVAPRGNHEITVLGKGVVVPPYTAIGRDCRILPHAGPADFSTNTFPSGTKISHQSRGAA
jgi:glucose-1-phosphate adenylyltransferase